MTEILEFIKTWIEYAVSALGYPGIALVMAVENIFPPIPSELVMPFAGFLAASGRYNLIGVIAAGMVGSVAGALVLYYLGMWADELIIRRFVRRFGRFFLLSEADVDSALAFFSRYGDAAVFFGRLVPIVRSLISVPAGMQRMPLPKFLLLTVLGTTIWSTILSVAGYFLGQNWALVIDIIERYQRVILVLVALGVIAFIVIRVNALRRARQSAT
jgi:membrane protein DedA with SNARE-associated domain